MKLKDIVKVLNADVFTPDTYKENSEVNFAFGSDLMSDALMLLRSAPEEFCEEGALITGLVTKQSIRTAEMLDFPVVIVIRGKKPVESVFEAARESNITILGTKCSMFSTCGRLFSEGVKGISDL